MLRQFRHLTTLVSCCGAIVGAFLVLSLEISPAFADTCPVGYGFTCPPETNGGGGPQPAQWTPPLAYAIDAANGPDVPGVHPHTTPTSPTDVHLVTSFWIDGNTWRPLDLQGGLPGEKVEVTVSPWKVVWDFNDSSGITCLSAGSPDDETNCIHRYQETSRQHGPFTVSATMWWKGQWTCQGDCRGENEQPITISRMATLTLNVDEIQSTN